jgi:hypothetical protein
MFNTPTNPDYTHAEALTVAIRNLHPVSMRKWGMLITVTNDPTPANNITWLLKYNEASTDKADNDNWVDAVTVYGGDLPTILASLLAATSDKHILFNDGDTIGGFGEWDKTLARLLLGGNLVIDNPYTFTLRKSSADPNTKLVIISDWTGGAKTVGQVGNIDLNVFNSGGAINDSVATIFVLAQGVKSDGSMGFSKILTASFRKDGAADPVQIGANTDLASKDDSPDTPTVTLGLGGVGTTNIRISYDSNNAADVYTWTFSALIAFVKV